MRLPGSSAGRVGGACSPCTGRGLASRPCRQGRWWALTPPFHPYRPRLRRSATGGLFSVPLSVGFRRLPRGSVLPCGVRTFLDGAKPPRSPGLHRNCSVGLVLDYAIVGAGSAGCVLAARLSEDPAVNVLSPRSGRARPQARDPDSCRVLEALRLRGRLGVPYRTRVRSTAARFSSRAAASLAGRRRSTR